MTDDDCSSCEGWDQLDHRGLCPSCADSLDNDPWMVVCPATGEVARPGPYPRDQATHVARVHNHAAHTSQSHWEPRRVAA